MKLYMFRTVRLPIIRSLFTVHSAMGFFLILVQYSGDVSPQNSAMVYVIQVCRQLRSRTWSSSKSVYKPVWHTPMLSVQWINSWWWTDELSGTCSFMTK